MINKKWMRVFLLLYFLLLLRLILFKYPVLMLRDIAANWDGDMICQGINRANFEFFKTIRLYIRNWDMRGIDSFSNVIGNILVFIPMGYLLPRAFEPAEHLFVSMGILFLVDFGIEFVQLVTNFGVFDVDDILLNCLGGLIGFIFFRIIKLFHRKSRLSK